MTFWVFFLKNGRFTLNLENLDFEGETLLPIGDDDPTVIVSLRRKNITDYWYSNLSTGAVCIIT